MYSVHFTESARKQFSKLHRDIQTSVISSLERIKTRPQHFVGRLVGTNSYKLRVGDYRVIMDIFGDKLVILVIKVGHRKNV